MPAVVALLRYCSLMVHGKHGLYRFDAMLWTLRGGVSRLQKRWPRTIYARWKFSDRLRPRE